MNKTTAKPFAYAFERKARKEYTCAYCGEVIKKGDIYFEKTEMSEDRKFKKIKYCDPCYDTKNI